MLKKNIKKALVLTPVYIFITIILSSCNWQKCKAIGHILYKQNIIGLNSNNHKIELVIMQSAPIIQRVIDELKLENSNREPLKVEEFRKNLKLKQIEDTDVTAVSYKDSDRELAQKIVDVLMDEYAKEVIRSNHSLKKEKIESNSQIIFPERIISPVEIIQQAESSCSIFAFANQS